MSNAFNNPVPNPVPNPAPNPVPAKTPGRTRVVVAGTHPNQYNGYSKVVFELCRRLSAMPDLEVFVFGFQNVGNTGPHAESRALPGVHIHDAFAHETPQAQGFGVDQILGYVAAVRPDVFLVYNDMIVVYNFLQKLGEAPERADMRVLVYADQVYLHQRRLFLKGLNRGADQVIAFTPYWEEVLREQGVTAPMHSLRHGMDRASYYPVPQVLARRYFGLSDSDFIFMNLNRNQPRKRWDVCIKAWAEFVAHHRPAAGTERTPKLLIATGVTGAWDLMEMYERELGKRGLSLEDGKRHLILIGSP
jgi:glycosyltransferase involved in cell wall biosynthesis